MFIQSWGHFSTILGWGGEGCGLDHLIVWSQRWCGTRRGATVMRRVGCLGTCNPVNAWHQNNQLFSLFHYPQIQANQRNWGNSTLTLKVTDSLRACSVWSGAQALGVLYCTWLPNHGILVELLRSHGSALEQKVCICDCVHVCMGRLPSISYLWCSCLAWGYNN